MADSAGRFRSINEYPNRYPDFGSLPPDRDGRPQNELVESDSYEDQGETADVDLPPMRRPIDVRPSRPELIETKEPYNPPSPGDIGEYWPYR